MNVIQFLKKVALCNYFTRKDVIQHFCWTKSIMISNILKDGLTVDHWEKSGEINKSFLLSPNTDEYIRTILEVAFINYTKVL